MPRKNTLKKAVRALGFVLTLASLAFLGNGLFRQFIAILDLRWDMMDLAAVLCATISSAIGLFILAFSWALMLQGDRDPRRRLLSSVIIYAHTSIFKYLPGNIFHFVGRNVVGRQSGIGHGRLAAATVFEIGLSLFSAVLLSALIFSFAPAPLPQWLFRVIAFAFTAVGVTVLFYPSLLEILARFFPSSLPMTWLPQNLSGAMMSNFLAFCFMMIAAALMSLAILPTAVGPASASALFVLAWLVGFAVPGAPAGFGVREAFLVVELTPLSGEADALAFALIMRLVTTGGDAALYFGGMFFGEKFKRKGMEEGP